MSSVSGILITVSILSLAISLSSRAFMGVGLQCGRSRHFSSTRLIPSRMHTITLLLFCNRFIRNMYLINVVRNKTMNSFVCVV